MTKATTLRALLGCALLAGVYLLALAVLVAQLLLIIAVLSTATWQLALLGTLTLAPVSALAYGLLAPKAAGAARGPRIIVTPQQQPELWALTIELAEELPTAAPTTLRLAATVNAYASERSRFLGLIGGPRTLDLGLPLLLGLTRGELRAVICHELGHYAGRDTRLAAVSHRGSIALERTVNYLRALNDDQTSVKPAVRLLLALTSAYNRVYLRLTLAVRRSQELQADKAAADIAGAPAFARALQTLHVLVPLWEGLTSKREHPAEETAVNSSVDLPVGMLPDGVFRAFADRLPDPALRLLADEGATVALGFLADDGLGSHPPLAVRLAALKQSSNQKGPDPSRLEADAPAREILKDLPGLVADLQGAMDSAGAAAGTRGGTGVSVQTPGITKATFRFQLKMMLIGMCLVLGSSFLFHGVISPAHTDLPPVHPPATVQITWPGASHPPLIIPLEPPGQFTAMPLLPLK